MFTHNLLGADLNLAGLGHRLFHWTNMTLFFGNLTIMFRDGMFFVYLIFFTGGLVARYGSGRTNLSGLMLRGRLGGGLAGRLAGKAGRQRQSAKANDGQHTERTAG